MKVHKIVIPGRLVGIIAANRKSPYVGAKQKKQQQGLVVRTIQFQRIKAVKNYPVKIKINWFEKNYSRDADNITAAKKFIFDALQETNVLRNDRIREINRLSEAFYVDKLNPRIEVTIEEGE